MGRVAKTGRGAAMLAEMQEFSSFAPAEQRYICRALEVAAGSHSALRRWARDIDEARSIRNQARTYRRRDHVVRLLAEERYLEMAAPLTEISIFDLSQRQIRSFPAYRFLYERLIGGAVRPWLASSFGAAAVLPLLSPRHRGELIGTLAEDEVLRTDWPREEPVFFPRWVEMPVNIAA